MNSKIVAIFCILFTCTSAQAAMQNADFAGGNNGVGVVNQANGMQFDLNAGTTNLNWNKFNVGASETVNYNFNAANSTAFNQINSVGGASEIAGSINAIGYGAATSNIILNNAAGVSFVNGAVINVGAMTVQADSAISVEGLKVINGDLNLETTNGRIDVKGLIYENAGDLTIQATKQIAIGGIKNAAKLSAKTNSGIYVKAEDYMVGGEKVSGITADYIDLSSAKGDIDFEGGEVDVKNNIMVSTKGGSLNTTGGKITVGKDFIVITAGHFVGAPGAGINTIVTKNGTYHCDGYGTGHSKIENTKVVNQNGVLKIFAGKLDVNNSSVDNMIVSSGDFTVQNSTITNRLEIGLDGTKNNDTPTKIISSYIHDMEMEYSTLALDNATIDDLGINGTDLQYSNSVVNNNLYFTKFNNKKVSETITQSEINSLSGLAGNDSNLHLGYTKTMGQNYSSNINVTGDMANSNIYAATTGNINMDIANVNSLTINKSKNTTVDYAGDLKLNKIIAENDIAITAAGLINAVSSEGQIDSKAYAVNLNVAGSRQIGSGIDSDNRIYSIVSLGSNVFDVYDGAAYMEPVVTPTTPVVTPITPVVTSTTPVVTPTTPVSTPARPSTIVTNRRGTEDISTEQQNYVDTLNVDNSEYSLPTTNTELAAQFARNVKSLSADDVESQQPELKKTENGFSILKSFIPALRY